MPDILLTIVGTSLLILTGFCAVIIVAHLAFSIVSPPRSGRAVARLFVLPLIYSAIGTACAVASIAIRRYLKRTASARREAVRGFEVLPPR